jgi:probable Rubsico expression protein CbbX
VRYTGYGLLALVGVVGLVLAWLLLSHPLFALIVISLVGMAGLFAVSADGWRQTTAQNLASRGIYPESVRPLKVLDPGLRREYQAVLLPGRRNRSGSHHGTGPSATRGRRAETTPTKAPRTKIAPARALAAKAPAPKPAWAGTPAAKTEAAKTTKAKTARAKTPERESLPAVADTGIRLAPPPLARVKPAQSRPRPARQRGDTIPPDGTVTLAAERQAAGIDDLLAALDRQLIGLAPVKKKVEQVGSLLLVDRVRQRFELSASRPNLHMCFTGAPGTGKTTVALMMADLLHRLGYLQTPQVVHAMRDDLVGEFIGHTAPKTQAVLSRAMGGVLFIDEAYTLYRGSDSKDYGQECIDILLQVMENQRDRLVVILAGYKDRMDTFFASNPGMRSRVAHHLDFARYELDELLMIGGLMLDRSSYYLSPDAKSALRDQLAQAMEQPGFANARSVRNTLELARFRHARRLVSEPERRWTKDDLMRLEPSDIVSGRE